MKILVLNCGSSSIKYKLYDMNDHSVLAAGGVERIGLDEAFLKVTLPNGEKRVIMHDMPDHKEGVNFVFQTLLDKEIGAIKDLSEIDAVGHRVVQGGDKFCESTLVTPEVEQGIEELCDLAPVHNAGHLRGIRAVDALMPTTPQVVVFDNAFHSTMPEHAFLYAVVRKIPCSPLRFSRNQSPLCISTRVRFLRLRHQNPAYHHLSYRQWRQRSCYQVR